LRLNSIEVSTDCVVYSVSDRDAHGVSGGAGEELVHLEVDVLEFCPSFFARCGGVGAFEQHRQLGAMVGRGSCRCELGIFSFECQPKFGKVLLGCLPKHQQRRQRFPHQAGVGSQSERTACRAEADVE
jgi:hypothetical protein